MNKYVFLYKENNTDDRDCVKYIERIEKKLECGHYFPSVRLVGACFSTGLSCNPIEYDEITTILTEEELNRLKQFDREIGQLGYGIELGSEKYLKGVELIDGIQPILDKLDSKENEELFKRVQEEEIEYLQDEYSLDDEDIQLIFDTYYLEHRDRGIVSHVWDDIDELAEEEAEQLGYVENGKDRYFNYELFGKDLLESDQHLELSDGRIVTLNY